MQLQKYIYIYKLVDDYKRTQMVESPTTTFGTVDFPLSINSQENLHFSFLESILLHFQVRMWKDVTS